MSWAMRSWGAWREKIAYIGVTEEDRAAGYDRRRGFEAGLLAAGVVLDPHRCVVAPSRSTRDIVRARELLADVPDVSFIACATDTMAAGACALLMRRVAWARAYIA